MDPLTFHNQQLIFSKRHSSQEREPHDRFLRYLWGRLCSSFRRMLLVKIFKSKINSCTSVSLLACLYLPILSCSNGPTGTGSANDSKKVTVSKNGENQDDENSLADLPSEIAGGFLTCSYVTPKEAEFSPSDTNVPVGCAVMMGADKVTDNRYTYKLKIYNTQKKSQPLATKIAPESSSWHQYGDLGRYGNQDKNLGMTIADRQSGVEYKPLLFPIRNLRAQEPDAMLNLVGGYKSGGHYARPRQNGNLTSMYNWGIVPESFCDGSKRLPEADRTKVKTIQGMPGVQELGEILDAFTGKEGIDKISNMEITAKVIRTGETAVACPVKTQITDQSKPSLWPPLPLPGGGQYVVEGAGCLFISYFDEQGTWRVLMYDQDDRRESGIDKGLLESFVKYQMVQRSSGKSKGNCPSELPATLTSGG
jgi:hypothetical protein